MNGSTALIYFKGKTLLYYTDNLNILSPRSVSSLGHMSAQKFLTQLFIEKDQK